MPKKRKTTNAASTAGAGVRAIVLSRPTATIAQGIARSAARGWGKGGGGGEGEGGAEPAAAGGCPVVNVREVTVSPRVISHETKKTHFK